ncbi:ArsR/SmtB family transcription factor [Sporosalibacterium faouarense]|uniref:ArsR/SmtB family transcription factor n=1 Tax=Sporosalibacterium faouarense TaxID=516123 RepID=UPI00192BEFA2|nr:metalloregulator ArsR/SmtB family transcription factor [Sporosalibacterium faouarense]
MYKIVDNIYVESSDVYELLSSMLRVNCQEEMILNDSRHKKIIRQDIIQWVDSVRNSLSENMKKELSVFFNTESFLGLGLVPLIWEKEKHRNIEDFIEFFKKEVLAKEIVKGFFNNGYKKDTENHEELDDFPSLKDAIDFIDELNVPKEDKWNLLHFYQNPEEAKERLFNLIEEFYNLYFIHELDKIREKQVENIEKIRKELSENYYEKMRKILTFDLKFIDDLDEFVFIPSYYHGVGVTSSQMDKDTFLVVFGIGRLDLFLKEEEIDIIEALKSFSDEKRFKMIQLLKENSYYGYELGQKLNLSNSTVSHHLGILANHEIINPIRLENKIYYEVNKDKIREILKLVEETLI